jgi:hypothetical protein
MSNMPVRLFLTGATLLCVELLLIRWIPANVVYFGAIFGPLWLRVPVGSAIVIWGALTNRPWTVPVGATWAIPLLAYFNLSLLVALVPLALPAAVPHVLRWSSPRGRGPVPPSEA